MIRLSLNLLGAAASLGLAACGGTNSVSFPREDAPPSTSSAVDGGVATTTTGTTPSSTDAATPFEDAGATPDDAAAGDATLPTPSPSPSPAPDAGDLVTQLQAITASCTVASNGTYTTDRSTTAAVNVCALNGAFFWTADLAIDCDGQQTTDCNSTTDSTFSAETSVTQSNGQPLIASQLPYVVVPLPGSRFDYTKEGIEPGALAIVISGNQMTYGVLGDVGPVNVIGEASYAMAASLGMSTNPNSGGTSGPVTYIVLTGKSAVVSPVENHASAVSLGATLVPQLIANN